MKKQCHSPWTREKAISRAGFTLTEMLVALAIVVIIASLLVPAVLRAIDSANATHCVSNLRQIGIAALGYASDHDSTLPPGTNFFPTDGPCWYNEFSKYMGSNPYTPSHYGLLSSVFACPSNTAMHKANGTKNPAFPSWPFTGDYGYNSLINGTNPITIPRVSSVTRLSMAPLVCEINYLNNCTTTTFMTMVPRSGNGVLAPTRHNGGCNVLMFDGHVSFFLYADLQKAAMTLYGTVPANSANAYPFMLGNW